jgi:ornithine cyclodeaminase
MKAHNASPHIFNAEQTRNALPYLALCDAISGILKSYTKGRIMAPERLVASLAAKGTLLLMPASDGRTAITKLVTVHPDNRKHELPTIQGEVIVFEAETGRRLGILDGVTVTARRTAALSALAARTLAPAPAGGLLVIGAGTQARSHLEAFREVLSVERAFIYSRTRTHAEELAGYGRSIGFQIDVIDDPESILADVTLIVTATNSASPVLEGRLLRQDAFIAAVGAFTPAMTELPTALVNRCRLFVDTLEGARAEAGDYIQAKVDWTEVLPLVDAIDRPTPEKGPVLFKSVGHAMFDLAAARLVFA